MSDAYGTALVEEGTSVEQWAAGGVVGAGLGAFVLAFTSLFEVTSVTTEVGGAALIDVYGGALVAMGVAVIGLGVASRAGVTTTEPSESAGLIAGTLVGLIGLIVTGLVVSQTLGFGAAVWVPAALVGGVAATLATVLPREDVGSTVPLGLYGVGVGLLILLGVLGLDWTWSPEGLSATFSADITVPFLTAVSALIVSWAAAKAYDGFGSQGRQTAAYYLITLVAIAILSVLVLLVGFIASKGVAALTAGANLGALSVPFLQQGNALTNDINGIYPAIVGTFWVVLGAIVLAVPLAVGAAVFLTEYAEQGQFTNFVEVATNALWSTPSIVFGLFGYAFLVPRFGNGASLLSGMIVLAAMLLPLVLITSREALLGVADEYRDASAALGATQWQTIRSVVLPAAMPGVITGIILGVGRIAGETAPLLLVMSGSIVFPSKAQAPNVLDLGFGISSTFPFVDVSVISTQALLQQSTALPYQLYALITAGVGGTTSAPGAEVALSRMEIAWGTALVLLLVVMSFYAVGIASRKYFRAKLNQ